MVGIFPNAYRNSTPYGTLRRADMRCVYSMKRILIIEDDRDIVELVRYNLANEGYQVSAAHDGSTGLSTLKNTSGSTASRSHAPEASGLEICREVRRDDSLNRLPILMLTARGEEADRVVGLEMGADDYVTKPFSRANCSRASRRCSVARSRPPRRLASSNWKLAIDPASYRVSHSGKPVPLSTLEFRLLYYLASRRTAFLRGISCSMPSGHRPVVTPRSVDVYVRRCAKKSNPIPRIPPHLKTVRGAAICLKPVRLNLFWKTRRCVLRSADRSPAPVDFYAGVPCGAITNGPV